MRNYAHHDLGRLLRGDIVEVSLTGDPAKVRVLDDWNFERLKNGERYSYLGRTAPSPGLSIAIPHAANWHALVGLAAKRGTVGSRARVIAGPLSAQPLATVPSLLRIFIEVESKAPSAHEKYDVFISHASQDKDAIVRPLATALMTGGLKVWYDEFELKIGDSLRQKIDKGVANSRFGIVVLSRSFIKKGWTNYELDGIVTKAVNGEQVILPIWHDITRDEVIAFSPSLADKLARHTSAFSIDQISAEIIDFVTGDTGSPEQDDGTPSKSTD